MNTDHIDIAIAELKQLAQEIDQYRDQLGLPFSSPSNPILIAEIWQVITKIDALRHSLLVPTHFGRDELVSSQFIQSPPLTEPQ